jgi:cyclopropane-fatty-acyl-phospholipid synthase
VSELKARGADWAKERRRSDGGRRRLKAARKRADVSTVLAPLIGQLLGGELPVGVRAWDGSEAGPAGGPVLVLRRRQALRRILWHPGELGVAQAYVTGDLDVDGDLTEGLRTVRRALRARAGAPARSRWRPSSPLPPGLWGQAARAALTLGVLGPPPPAPASQARVTGRLHSKLRDQAVIAHHYDVPPAFYQLILDENMAYSCGYWPSAEAGLAAAQTAKLDQIARKLALGPGVRLLDVGCGWGSLSLHAAREYGARVTAVTLSKEQAGHVRQRAADAGLSGLVEVRTQDYREITGGTYDAVASVEMGEHVGAGQYPAFCALIAARLRPGGRALIQQMSRAAHAPGGGAFIESYIAPDMHMRPAAETAGLLEGAGLEIRDVEAMREHYPPTIRAWLAALESRWDEATALIGPEAARVWRLYLAGAALAFEEGRMGVDQLLAVRPTAAGRSGIPLGCQDF